jgi:hypothetical protein
MDLPDVKAGMAILAEHVQRLNAAIKQVRLRPGIGYMLKESPGGTSIVITQGQRASGGGGVVCQYFEVTDASEGTTLKVEVAQNLIAGRWPENMGPDTDPFKLTITANAYIYAAIYWDIVNLVIGSDLDAIKIIQSPDLLQNTDSMQYILIATVIVEGDPQLVTSITNVCSEPVPNPCLLDWSA